MVDSDESIPPSASRGTDAPAPPLHARLRQVVRFVALANIAYCAVELTVGQAIGSVSLFADSIDFLEDAAVNGLILLALDWPIASRARIGQLLAALLLAPGLATLWTAWRKFADPVAPHALALGVVGGGALVVNLACAGALVRFRESGGSLTKAAFLSARNDAFANLGIIGAGVATHLTRSHWPDLVVGLGIFAMNLDSAGEVFAAARHERNGAPNGEGTHSGASG